MSIHSPSRSPSGSPGGSQQWPHPVPHPARATTRFHVPLWILVTSIAVTTFFHVGTAVWQQQAVQLPNQTTTNAPTVSSHHRDQQSHAPPRLPRRFPDHRDAAKDKKRISLRKKAAARSSTSVEDGEEECPTMDALSKPVPTFVLAGAQKAGTSAFYHLLRAHPAIQSSRRFEPHFFDASLQAVIEYRNVSSLSSKEVCYYRRKYRDQWRSTQAEDVTFEKTPKYLCAYQTAEYVRRIAPWTKILVVLRNPVDRAFSNWKLSYQTVSEHATVREICSE